MGEGSLQHNRNLDEVGQHWTHCAMARESRLLLEVVVGPRTQESATELVEGAARRLAYGCWPLWSSDGWEPYLFALTLVFAVLIHFIKGKGPGRLRQSQVAPDPRVRYGQVIKQRAGRRLASVVRRVIFGVEELIPLKQISTSLLERLNGAIRQHVAPLHRKTRSFAKCRTALDTQTQLFKSYYNLCRKHGSLKGQDASASSWLDRSSVVAQRTANLQFDTSIETYLNGASSLSTRSATDAPIWSVDARGVISFRKAKPADKKFVGASKILLLHHFIGSAKFWNRTAKPGNFDSNSEGRRDSEVVFQTGASIIVSATGTVRGRKRPGLRSNSLLIEAQVAYAPRTVSPDASHILKGVFTLFPQRLGRHAQYSTHVAR